MPEHQQPFELSWHPVLVQERDITNSTRTKSTIRPVEIGDPVEDNRNDVEIPLLADIPPGIETNHLIDAGFRCWSDLYSVRQLDALSTALTEVRALAYSKRVRDRLALAVLNTAELPAYVCRWDRFHPKIFEAMANHRYSRSNVVVEANLLSPVGRGTLPRRLRSSASALTWLLERRRELPPVRNAVIGRHSRASSRDVTVVTGSSRRQLIATGSAKLVLTDPPYHDDVQYGELARLFHAWLEVYQRLGAIDECEEAVPNRTRELGASHFLDTIADCLAESRRSLAVDGRLVLTFHNNNRRAWEALQVALRRAELVVLEIAAVTAENKADHSKRGNKVFLSDLVIECGHKANRDQSASLMVVRPPTTNEERNLVAAGMALADHVNDSIDMHFMMRYQLHLERLGGTAALIR
jgi:adenine-specific DNA methylase